MHTDLKFEVHGSTWKGHGVANHVGPHTHFVTRNETLRSEIRGLELAWFEASNEGRRPRGRRAAVFSGEFAGQETQTGTRSGGLRLGAGRDWYKY